MAGNVTGTRMSACGLLLRAMATISYARHQFPPDIIRHAVWLYLRFTLSYRDVEDGRPCCHPSEAPPGQDRCSATIKVRNRIASSKNVPDG